MYTLSSRQRFKMVPVYRIGNVNEKDPEKSLDSATDVYISLVDKCPCAGMVINLYKGACNTDLQHERVTVKRPFSKEQEKKKSF